MKIAHVVTQFSSKNPGGVENVVDEIASRQARHHEVEIICRNAFNDSKRDQKNNYLIKRASCIKFSGLRTLSSLYTMRRIIRESDADVFHIHDWSPAINYVLASKPEDSILTLHNLATRSVSKFFEHRAVDSVNKVTCVSSWLTDIIDKRYDLQPVTVNNGVDLQRFYHQSSKGYALFIGSLDQRKGIKPVCEVFNKIDQELKVIGDGPLRDIQHEYEHEFLGNVSDKELAEMLSEAEYLVVPSRKEGFGLVWLEAIASGKPIIATETGVGAEIPSYCGEIISTDYTEEDLREAAENIAERKFDAERLQQYALNYDWERLNQKYMRLYQEITE
ncbi:glycosyltransferase family 4 protein [Candidatus Nanohalococcus occultus]|uniref:glycosyltransferase family 4 protein n=1 Tax=Candidatus Nanohalococcus occultus TaxID=2978047 RepID=UPI0039E16CFD